MNILKSIGAVIAGLFFIFLTHNGTDLILESLGIFTPITERFETTWMVVTALVYRIIFSIAGCYVTAWLAPSRPLLHAMILGTIGLILSTIAAIVLIPRDLGPAWYPIALAVSALPCAWIGGKLVQDRLA
jgi:uncharacterized membrane protein